MVQTTFKMYVPKRKKPPVNKIELHQYWKGIIDLGIRELIVDNFAGGGGASTGIEEATGYSVDYAINHDPDAISMHKANHPNTIHFCESVWDVDPRTIAKGRPVGLVWLSPDCKHFSKAKGSKPVEKSIRGLAWVAIRWAATVRPRVIMLENVEEFKTWGPLLQDVEGNYYPDPKRKGQTFKSFIRALETEGYEVEWKEMRACDYGAPTIRKRFFMVARCDGLPIVFPEPTHGDPKKEEAKILSGELKPWETAASIIDWSIPCPSIFERKKPLADNTLRRIVKGIFKYVVNNPKPFIVQVNYAGSNHHYTREVETPLPTMTSKNGMALVTPFIARIGQTGFNPSGVPHSIHEPLSTIVTKQEHLLISSTLVKHYGGGYDGSGNDLNDPLSTITTVDHNALVSALLLQYNTETTENGMRGQSLDEPINTIPTANRYGLVTAHIAQHFGESIGHEMEKPTGTITAVNKTALVTSHMVKAGEAGNHHSEVLALLIAYYGSSVGQDLNDPLQTIVTKDRFGLVTIDSIDYQIVDIGMRMLESSELYPAQGFPKTYIIDGYLLDNGKPVPKSKQVARCGNSVSPPTSKALVRANLPHMCTGSGKVLAFHRYDPAVKANGQLELSI
jgi:DNA (cytosine-5)-methyltransferase 1